MLNHRTAGLPGPLRTLLRPLTDPYRRYRHAKLIHGMRVGLGVLLCLFLTRWMDLPHGEWASISLLIVIAGLQHHGNIRKRAAERAMGTVIGAVYGLFVIVEQSYLGMTWLTFTLMAAACAVCAYHAIGKGGYIALLSAITLVIVAGHGTNELADGIWRAINVLIGIALALLLSFALPLYATYSWRYGLADMLRGCAKLYTRIASGRPVSNQEHLRQMAALSAQLVRLRSLMPSVAKEIHVPASELEAVQRDLRICISSLEILASLAPVTPTGLPAGRSLGSEHREVIAALVAMARALKSGSIARLGPPPDAHSEMLRLSGNGEAPLSLSDTLQNRVQDLRGRLAAMAPRWNV